MPGPRRTAAPLLAALLALALPAAAAGQDEGPVGIEPAEEEPAAQPEPKKAKIELRLNGVKGKKIAVNRRVRARAKVKPFVPGQKLKIGFYREGKTVKQARKTIARKKGENAGVVKLRSGRFVRPGKYKARAVHKETPRQKAAKATTKRFAIKYPKLGGRSRGKVVKLFHKLLARQGYANAPSGKGFSAATGRAVHAFRKVNGMPRNQRASRGIFRKLAKGRGGFKLRYPGAGHHVEVDISRQVMVLADQGKPRFTYHISSGAPGTRSDRGHFRFYRRQPGYNSLRMYYSVYYNGGEATHGYHSVPNYPASHGCLRNPIPDARFIYSWIRLGDSIWVYD